MRLEEMLPDLIVIGAMKSGTTSLYHYLSLHPEIAMAQSKELHFFSNEQRWGRGVAWYEACFTNEAKIRGEASPSYTKYPLVNNVPDRMYSVVPEAKLIYILRDPVNRILSEYVHYRADGTEHRTLSKALADLKNNQYVYNSKYYTQLKQYLQFYPEANIFVTTLEELNAQPQQTLQDVFRFLDVDDSFYHPDYTQRFHASSEKRLKNQFGLFLTKTFRQSKIKNKIRSALPTFVDRVYISLSRSDVKIEKPVLDEHQRQALINELKDDIEQLRNYTGNKFEYWCL